VVFGVFRARFTKENATMALDQSALSALLDSLRAGGDMDFMREAMQLVLRALIDLEADTHIGAGRYERPTPVRRTATAAGPGCCQPKPATSNWPSRSCVMAASTRRCWSRVGGSIGRCGR
jgi:hypothetical protein